MTDPFPSSPLAPGRVGYNEGPSPSAALHLSGVPYGYHILPFRDEIKHLGDGGVAPSGPTAHQPVPSRRTDLGCKMVADGHFGGLAESSEDTKPLQIISGPQRVRTADLRRANATTNVLAGTAKCR